MASERQRTLVAWYGVKPPQIETLVRDCQHVLRSELNEWFQPYQLSQVHATVIGLEHRSESDNCNRNFATLRGRSEQMNIDGFIRFLRASRLFPISIQIGGFHNRDYPFASRSQRPYLRSFSIQRDKAVILGWPVLGKTAAEERQHDGIFRDIGDSLKYPQTLDRLRRSAQNYGILHQYHKDTTDIDNDFYLRLGTLSTPISRSTTEHVEGVLREDLSFRQPTIVNVEVYDLSVVSYSSESLPCESSQAIRIAEQLDLETFG